MTKGDRRWSAGVVLAVVGTGVAPVAVLGVLGSLNHVSDKRLAAVLAAVGVVITASVSLVGALVRHQAELRLDRQHREGEARLRLDAAMRAGALFNSEGTSPPAPAAVASGLLALTQLGRADLAVALLVDLWSGETSDAPADGRPRPSGQAVSDETAILVLDAALRSESSNAQLVAAELLCRNSSRLDICQSLHWPSSVDSAWNAAFAVKTKVLIVDALVRMAYEGDASLNALQSVAVRLYGIATGDPDPNVKGCLGMLLEAIVPALQRAKVHSLMQGPSEVTIAEIKAAAAQAKPNPDLVFFKVVRDRSEKLRQWADACRQTSYRPGALAAAAVSATETQKSPQELL